MYRIPEAVRDQIVTMALEEPELSPRELAVRFTDTEKYLRHCHSDQWHYHGSISEASVIDHYDNHRYHESIGNLTPADIYFGRGETMLA